MKEADIYYLVNLIGARAYKWKDICGQCGLLFSEVEAIGRELVNIKDGHSQCLAIGLGKWCNISSKDGIHCQDPTLDVLVKALQSQVVNEGALAQEILKNRNNLPSVMAKGDSLILFVACLEFFVHYVDEDKSKTLCVQPENISPVPSTASYQQIHFQVPHGMLHPQGYVQGPPQGSSQYQYGSNFQASPSSMNFSGHHQYGISLHQSQVCSLHHKYRMTSYSPHAKII